MLKKNDQKQNCARSYGAEWISQVIPLFMQHKRKKSTQG
jgi:hypothetical protein